MTRKHRAIAPLLIALAALLAAQLVNGEDAPASPTEAPKVGVLEQAKEQPKEKAKGKEKEKLEPTKLLDAAKEAAEKPSRYKRF